MLKIHMKQNINCKLKKHEIIGLEHYKDPKAFAEYTNDMSDVYKNIDEYNEGKRRKILIVFDDMIVVLISNKILNLNSH